MAKVFALGAYLYQAVLAFGLLILIARILPASDYATYSLFIATSQFVAIAFFEWVRFACSRFYPGRTALSEATQRQTIIVEGALCALACMILGAETIVFGLSAALALIGAAVSILLGS